MYSGVLQCTLYGGATPVIVCLLITSLHVLLGGQRSHLRHLREEDRHFEANVYQSQQDYWTNRFQVYGGNFFGKKIGPGEGIHTIPSILVISLHSSQHYGVLALRRSTERGSERVPDEPRALPQDSLSSGNALLRHDSSFPLKSAPTRSLLLPFRGCHRTVTQPKDPTRAEETFQMTLRICRAMVSPYIGTGVELGSSSCLAYLAARQAGEMSAPFF